MLQTKCTYQGKRPPEGQGGLSLASACMKQAALELLWPTRCAVCDAPGALVCDTCRRALRYYDPWLACATCGAPFGRLQCCECNSHTRARRGQLEHEPLFCSSAVLFDPTSSSIVRCYKDAGEQRLAAFMAQAMKNALSPEKWHSFDALAFIPDSPASYLERGFDHMEALAHELAQAANLPLLLAFQRPRTCDQRNLSQRQRRENLEGAFELRAAAKAIALPAHVLLIDDVMTTGATLTAAASTLRAAGVPHVSGLTFARVV